ncbi:MAG: DUF2061 domain-containing protein [Rickettsiales bacterium]|jgi:uncharacterized membrane protein|nr:DUF2061 domain-containing protein [Rickettsiales bacterium]
MTRLIFEHEITAKTLTYCLMHFAVAIAVAYAISGSWEIALAIGIIEPLVQTFFFNMHERGWNKASRNYKRQIMDGGLSV